MLIKQKGRTKMKTNEVVKNRIRELVDGLSISKAQCAKEIEISYSTLNRLYNHGNNARIVNICKIADYFCISVDYILGLSDDKEIKSHRR